ncbi:MAG: hypothetical protein LBD46_06095 [Endomicrobium sp.]|nr:hypothetical protein [Endomicrobium sp.]
MIQDLHCHHQTPKNISQILSFINRKYNLLSVYLEGSYSNHINFQWLKSVNEKAIGKDMIDALLNTGKLNGVEYFYANNDVTAAAAGIESAELYMETINLLNELISKRKELSEITAVLQEQIETIKQAYFTKVFLRY